MHYKAVVFQQISRNKRVWLLVIYNKKGQKLRKSEKTSVFGFAAGPEQAGSSAFGAWKRGLWLCFPHGQLLGRCQISASSQDQSFGWHPHPSLHIKKILPPQALKIPLGLGTQPPFQQLLTRAVAGPGASHNQEEKEAVWWKPAHTWVSLKCPVHRKNKNLPFLCQEISVQPWSHSFFSFLGGGERHGCGILVFCFLVGKNLAKQDPKHLDFSFLQLIGSRVRLLGNFFPALEFNFRSLTVVKQNKISQRNVR